jgi:hypothetical protein
MWRAKKCLLKSLAAGDELDRALAGEEIVVEHARGGDHSKATVLELNKLAAGKGLSKEPEMRGGKGRGGTRGKERGVVEGKVGGEETMA